MSQYSDREKRQGSGHDANIARAAGENESRGDDATTLFDTANRRQFIGGLTSLLAASAFSLTVPDDAAAQVTDGDDSATQTLTSPDNTVAVTVAVADDVPRYSVAYDGTTVIEDSSLGFEFRNQDAFRDGITVTGSERSTTDTTWTPVWDQYDEIREHYEELRIGFEESGGAGRALTLAVRAFNDGIGFRFVFPEDGGFGDFVITSERTEFAFADDYTSWWIPNDYDNFELEYNETPVSDVGSDGANGGAHTPITMKAGDDLYASVHEADLADYGSLAIEPSDDSGTTLESTLAPLPDGTKVSAAAPHRTPWRTVQLATDPGDLIESSLVLNLNDPLDEDAFTQGTDWIRPQKFIGVWWLMITGRADWEYTGETSGNHGAQTGRVKQYMDFASEHDIPGVLVEGWNQGWSSYPGDGSEFEFDPADPDNTYPDFDFEDVTSYGPSLDSPTQMTMHNETAGDFRNYESQIEDAFDTYDDIGIRTIKNGYVADDGDLAGGGFNHHNQVLVNHHTLVARTAAANRQMLDIHEPIHPTGRRRTYPNLMTREGVKGQEYDAFGSVSPEHHVTFPFTRMLGGPVEFTPGIFDMESGSGGIETTRAKQLAMYPTYFSGLQMVADLPSSYLADRPATLSVGEVTQAQYARLDGFTTQSEWANAQGEAYVPFDPNSVDDGSTATWTVEDVADAGEYDLHLRFANDAEENALDPDTDRMATLLVNGSAVDQLTVPTTEYWDVWESISTTVSLEAGDNDIGLSLTGNDTGGFNLDSIAVTGTGGSMPEPATPPIRGPTVPEFEFIEDVPADWDDTNVIDSAIGDYTITARRKGEEWYVGVLTDENGRALDVPLDFLDSAPGERTGHEKSEGRGHDKSAGERTGHTNGEYVAEIHSDGIDAEYDANLEDVRIDEAIVSAEDTILASTIETGGTAIRLRPATADEASELPAYERPTQSVSVSIDTETTIGEQYITATGSNDGDYIGGTPVELLVDGTVEAIENVRFAPGAVDERYTLAQTIDEAGTYDVTVCRPDGTELASETVSVAGAETVASISDPSGDDNGPGEYTYPTDSAFEESAFDLLSFEVTRTPSVSTFTFEVDNLYNAYGSDRGFSPQMFVLWLRDPDESDGTTAALDDYELTAEFEEPWHYRLEASGFTQSAVNADGADLTDSEGNAIDLRTEVDTEANTVALSIDNAAFGGANIEDMEIVAVVQSEQVGTLRDVAETASDEAFGGAKPDAVENAPRVMDVLTPAGAAQAEVLAYSADQLATLPFVSLGSDEPK